MRWLKRSGLLLPMLLTSLVLSPGCSGDDDDSSQASTSPSPVDPTDTPTTTTPTDTPTTTTPTPAGPTDTPLEGTATPGETEAPSSPTPSIDADLDGYTADEDCDDQDATVNPGAAETCDAQDNDCDHQIDEDAGQTWYVDHDDDGYGADNDSEVACAQPNGYAAQGGDCDNHDKDVNPGASEACDGVDNDCDGTVDAGIGTLYYPDQDHDGYGTEEGAGQFCDEPTGYAEQSGDCDDGDPGVSPDDAEVCDGKDNDCNQQIDNGVGDTWYPDVDGDGYGIDEGAVQACDQPAGFAAQSGDCDDADASVSPGDSEVCDGKDNDCDLEIDDAVGDTWYPDADADGYGVNTGTAVSCAQPEGYAAAGGDCDDAEATTHPDAADLCDGVDNDCDLEIDEDGKQTWYLDHDSDGYGSDATTQLACDQPDGYVGTGGDCNDKNSSINPGAFEACDGIDNDCDGIYDEGTVFYRDADGDGWGADGDTVVSCEFPSGYVAQAGDCDDDDPSVYPGAYDLCDRVDNDCDGQIDEDDGAIPYYYDGDQDGYGTNGDSQAICGGEEVPEDYVADGGDCDDEDPSIYPDAVEVCDGVDNNCDGHADEDNTFYPDEDLDGWGTEEGALVSCDDSFPPEGYSGVPGDCDDTDPTIYPGAFESCDGVDSNCDGVADAEATVYADDDHDGYGGDGTETACGASDGYSLVSGDCDDTDANIYPGAYDACDGVDNDCDGSYDEDGTSTFYRDDDGDGYGIDDDTVTSCEYVLPDGYTYQGGDCDDADVDVYPYAYDFCDGKDNDCDGEIDNDANVLYVYPDADGDGWGDDAGGLEVCETDIPDGYVTYGGDCDDDDITVNPGAYDECDGVDNDCDGAVDQWNLWYPDSDQDGYGDDAGATVYCEYGDAPEDYTGVGGDCDDTDEDVSPGAAETCDGIDNDCDGEADEQVTWFADGDGDGYGTSSSAFTTCETPDGYAQYAGDCDDADPAVYPGAYDACDGIDNDCSGVADEDGGYTYYLDQDADGYGTSTATVYVCEQPEGYSEVDGDCDDDDATSNPGAAEACDDGRDNDCDGTIDDAVTWYPDLDGDGYGDTDAAVIQCEQIDAGTQVRGDCDDEDSSVHPGADDTADDGIDADCGGFDSNDPHVGLSDASYASLQQAIDAATDQETIWVGPGNYLEAGGLDFKGKPITLISTHGADLTGIATAGSQILFQSGEATDTVFDGFSIEEARTYLSGSSPTIRGCDFGYYAYDSSALYIESSSPMFSDCRFHDNYTTFDGGLFTVYDSDLLFDGCILSGGQADGSGGAMYAVDSNVTLTGSTISGNSAFEGGGLHLYGSSLSLTDTTVSSNYAVQSGGGLYLGSGDAEISGGSIQGNNGGYGGGLYATGGTLALEGTEVNSNSGGEGAGLYLDGTAGVFESCTITGNNASDAGGGLYVDSANPSLNLCVVGTNYAATLGGGVYLTSANASILDTAITGNNAGLDGGGLYAVSSTPAIAGSTIDANYASQYGGGLYLESSSAVLSETWILANAAGYGGGLYLSASNPVLVSSHILSNVATFAGGGLQASASQPLLTNCTVSENQSYGTGGGLDLSGSNATMALSNCRIDANLAVSGGGIYMDVSSPTMTNVVLEDNVASGSGGGMYLSDSSPTWINGALVSNTSSGDGGGMYVEGSASGPKLQNSILAYNYPYNVYASSYNSSTTILTYNDLYDPYGAGNHNLSSLSATNKTVEPGYLSYDENGLPTDLHLAKSSSLVNAGSTALKDVDNSRSDMGSYGGAAGGSWDQDGDAYNDYFWPGEITDAPAGFNANLYDCDDQDPDVQNCL